MGFGTIEDKERILSRYKANSVNATEYKLWVLIIGTFTPTESDTVVKITTNLYAYQYGVVKSIDIQIDGSCFVNINPKIVVKAELDISKVSIPDNILDNGTVSSARKCKIQGVQYDRVIFVTSSNFNHDFGKCIVVLPAFSDNFTEEHKTNIVNFSTELNISKLGINQYLTQDKVNAMSLLYYADSTTSAANKPLLIGFEQTLVAWWAQYNQFYVNDIDTVYPSDNKQRWTQNILRHFLCGYRAIHGKEISGTPSYPNEDIDLGMTTAPPIRASIKRDIIRIDQRYLQDIGIKIEKLSSRVPTYSPFYRDTANGNAIVYSFQFEDNQEMLALGSGAADLSALTDTIGGSAANAVLSEICSVHNNAERSGKKIFLEIPVVVDFIEAGDLIYLSEINPTLGNGKACVVQKVRHLVSENDEFTELELALVEETGLPNDDNGDIINA